MGALRDALADLDDVQLIDNTGREARVARDEIETIITALYYKVAAEVNKLLLLLPAVQEWEEAYSLFELYGHEGYVFSKRLSMTEITLQHRLWIYEAINDDKTEALSKLEIACAECASAFCANLKPVVMNIAVGNPQQEERA